MANVTEHDAKEERESNCREISRVDLFVGRGSISVNDILEHLSEGIGPDESRRLDAFARDLLNLNAFAALLLNLMQLVE